jgi:UDP:flavonoid glycosyltransferase YjiC (YdhE family)
MKLGLFTPAASGHLNPALALAKELTRRRHEVMLFCVPEARQAAELAGCRFLALQSARLPSGASVEERQVLQGKSGPAAVFSIIKLLTDLAGRYLQEADQVLGEHRDLDGLLIDVVSPELFLVAEKYQLPYVAVSSSIPVTLTSAVPPAIFSWEHRANGLGRLRNWLGWQLLTPVLRPAHRLENQKADQWGLPRSTKPLDPRRASAYLTTCPPNFDFPRPDGARYTYCGPFVAPETRIHIPFDWSRISLELPLVYASLGTEFNNQVDIHRTILQALQEMDVSLVVSVGKNIADSEVRRLQELNPSAIVVRSAPQLELLQRASAFITHAGMNSVLESLIYGVPTVAIPITADQPGIAARICRAGVGEMLTPKQLNPKRLREMLTRVMSEPSYQLNLKQFQDWIAAHSGIVLAADEIEKVLSSPLAANHREET